MNREAFEHLIRAAHDIVRDDLVVVGSQALLGVSPTPEPALLRSMELDLYPRQDPKRAIEIDGAIGDGSRFQETFGYYAHGVGPETIIAPAGWRERLVQVRVPTRSGDAIAWCLSIDDLLLSKLAAGRSHDLDFVETALATNLTTAEALRLGVPLIPKSDSEDVAERLEGVIARVKHRLEFESPEL